MTSMPAAPRKHFWELTIRLRDNDAVLYLRKKDFFSSRGDLISLEFVAVPDQPSYDHLPVSTASLDDLVEGVAVAAHRILDEIGQASARHQDIEDKAAELKRRLGIKVKVTR